MMVVQVKVAQQRVHREILQSQGAKKATIDATRFMHATSSVFSIAMMASASVAVDHSLWGSVTKRPVFDLGIALSVLLVLVAIPGTLGLQKQARVAALKGIAAAAVCFTVVSIAVEEGEKVFAGQELLVLEVSFVSFVQVSRLAHHFL